MLTWKGLQSRLSRIASKSEVGQFRLSRTSTVKAQVTDEELRRQLQALAPPPAASGTRQQFLMAVESSRQDVRPALSHRRRILLTGLLGSVAFLVIVPVAAAQIFDKSLWQEVTSYIDSNSTPGESEPGSLNEGTAPAETGSQDTKQTPATGGSNPAADHTDLEGNQPARPSGDVGIVRTNDASVDPGPDADTSSPNIPGELPQKAPSNNAESVSPAIQGNPGSSAPPSNLPGPGGNTVGDAPPIEPPGQGNNPGNGNGNNGTPPGQDNNPGTGNGNDGTPPGQDNNPGNGTPPVDPPGQGNNPGNGNGNNGTPPGQDNNPGNGNGNGNGNGR